MHQPSTSSIAYLSCLLLCISTLCRYWWRTNRYDSREPSDSKATNEDLQASQVSSMHVLIASRLDCYLATFCCKPGEGELTKTDLCLLNRMKEVFSCLSILFVLILNVCYVVIADASCFIVHAIKHVASFSQIYDCKGIRLLHEVVVLKLLGRD